MRKIILWIGIIVLMTSSLAIARPLFWKDRISGTYVGKVYSGNQFQTVETKIVNTKGLVEGRYIIFEKAGPSIGTLTNLRKIDQQTYLFEWNDEYGSGVLNITFSPTFDAFKGKWRTMDVADSYYWFGRRK